MIGKIVTFNPAAGFIIGPINENEDGNGKINDKTIEETYARMTQKYPPCNQIPPCLPWDHEEPIGPVEIIVLPRGKQWIDEEKYFPQKPDLKAELKVTMAMMQEPMQQHEACDESEPAAEVQSCKKASNK